MPRSYGASGKNTLQAAPATAVSIIGATTVRPSLYSFNFGNPNAPADQAYTGAITRFTADGTGTAGTVKSNDPGDVAALATTKNLYTAEPTYEAVDLFTFAANQRANYQWFAWQQGYELKAPATASNGLGLRIVTSTTNLQNLGNVNWYE